MTHWERRPLAGRAANGRTERRAAPRPASRRRSRESAVLPARRFRWRGAAAEEYRDFAGADMVGATRQVLAAGSGGAAIGFDVRYFELAPAARTRLETHRHAHVVVVLRGTGRVRLGRSWMALRRFDACYIAPRTVHQLQNDQRRRFGFLCIVDARRDRGVPVARKQRDLARRGNAAR